MPRFRFRLQTLLIAVAVAGLAIWLGMWGVDRFFPVPLPMYRDLPPRRVERLLSEWERRTESGPAPVARRPDGRARG